MVGALDNNYQRKMSYIADAIYQSELSGYFYIYKDNKVGVVDSSSKVVVPFEYNSCRIVNGKYFIVTHSGKTGLLDLDGNSLFTTDYEDIAIVENKNRIYFRPKKNGLYAYFDEDLKMLADFESEVYFIHNTTTTLQRNSTTPKVLNQYGVPIPLSHTSPIRHLIHNDSLTTSIAIHLDSSFTILQEPYKAYKLIYSDRCYNGCFNGLNGLLGFKHEGKEGVINSKGQIVLVASDHTIVDITNYLIITKQDHK